MAASSSKSFPPPLHVDALRYCWVELPRCPRCGSAEHKVYKTIRHDDGQRQQYALCRGAGCGHKFIILAK